VRAHPSNLQARCCIVIADENRPERVGGTLNGENTSSRSAEAAMKMGFLRQASLRASRLVSAAHVLLSAQESDRNIWERPLWFTRPANRFIADSGTPTALSTAAAILSVAAGSPSCLVAILPSDFWVARGSVLIEAIERVFTSLHRVPGGVATLGMVDAHTESDEDYLVVGPDNAQTGAVIHAKWNRPALPIARQLTKEGAIVFSGILLGYAHAFSAHIYEYWPHLARELDLTRESNSISECEHRFPYDAYRHIPRSVIGSVRWSAPTFPMRVFRVQGSGWCSRKFPREVAIAPAAGRQLQPQATIVSAERDSRRR
jgi:mannose-1-phosphate guanylyltransferase